MSTLAELTIATAASSRGRTADRLARLRELGLIGYRGVRGRRGHVSWWLRGGRVGIGTFAYRSRAVGALIRGNDSVAPLGRFLTRVGLAAGHLAAAVRGIPPGPAGRRGRTRPRRGQPPHVLYGACPSGHRIRLGRWSWTAGAAQAQAEFVGLCRRCRARCSWSVQLRLAPAELKSDTPTAAGPDELARRRRIAQEFVAADPGLAAQVHRWL